MKPPLKLFRDVFSRHNFYLQDADGSCVLEADCDYQADMQYIIAAVNACHRAGLTVEELEAGAIGELVNQMREVDDCLSQMGWHTDRGVLQRVKSSLRPFMKTAE